jgi:glycosyltransferase involved in cell wall biosynthesis
VTKWPVLLMVRSLEHGGCERDLTKIALHLDRDRFEPHVGIFRGGFRRPELEAAGIPILDLPVTSFRNRTAWQGFRKLGRYLRTHNIQLVHAFDVPTDMFAAPAAHWFGVPAIVTSQLSYRNLVSRGSRAALRLSDTLSQRVVVNSRAVGESLEREFGLAGEKVYLCYNGVDLTQFHPAGRVRPASLKDASLVIGSVCVMRPEKRVDWVIRAFGEVRCMDTGAKLLLVGSGPEASRLRELTENLGLRDACHFEESQADVAQWMRAIDIYINSSVSESFPNGLLEAMACGCCVIGSKVGGIPELITHKEDGLIFDSNRPDDLASLLRLAANDRELRQKLQAKAVDTASQRFSIAIATQRVESLYEDLLSLASSR